MKAPAPDPRSKPCTSCSKLIIFLPTSKGNRMPTDAETVEPGDLQFMPNSKHVSHFATCSNSAHHRTKKRRYALPEVSPR